MRIAYVLDTFPALSQTFVTEELFGLRRRGLEVVPYALVHKHGEKALPASYLELERETVFVPEKPSPWQLVSGHVRLALRRPRRYLKTVWWAWQHRLTRRLTDLLATAWRLVRGKETDKRTREDVFWHFALVPIFAGHMVANRVEHVHAHFADNSASFGLLCSKLLDVPFSITAHAFDIFTDPPLLPEKLAHAHWVTTCTTRGQQRLRTIAEAANVETPIHLVYHGVDLRRFRPADGLYAEPPVLLAVGRLVPKKGFDVLLRAIYELVEARMNFQVQIVGDGPERAHLESLCHTLKLEKRVRFLGSRSPDEMPEVYQQAYLFVLPSVVDVRGDRDGIPNVVAEAMATALPVVSTTVSSVSDLVRDGVEGFLVGEKDPAALADRLATLIRDRRLRDEMGRAGRRRVEAVFDREVCHDQLAYLFTHGRTV